MCYSKSRYESIDFDIHGTILLEDELGFIGKKVTNMAVISLK
jgi:hypothetical protein